MIRFLFLFVVVLCVFVGYRIIQGLFKDRAFTESKHPGFDYSHTAQHEAELNGKELEKYYRDVLGVSEAAGEAEIKAAYRSQLAKYHPDKVTHLGGEFSELASSRTKDIIQAYDHLKNKYGFK